MLNLNHSLTVKYRWHKIYKKSRVLRLGEYPNLNAAAHVLFFSNLTFAIFTFVFLKEIINLKEGNLRFLYYFGMLIYYRRATFINTLHFVYYTLKKKRQCNEIQDRRQHIYALNANHNSCREPCFFTAQSSEINPTTTWASCRIHQSGNSRQLVSWPIKL